MYTRNLESPGIQCSTNVSIIIILRLAGFYLQHQWLSVKIRPPPKSEIFHFIFREIKSLPQVTGQRFPEPLIHIVPVSRFELDQTLQIRTYTSDLPGPLTMPQVFSLAGNLKAVSFMELLIPVMLSPLALA